MMCPNVTWWCQPSFVRSGIVSLGLTLSMCFMLWNFSTQPAQAQTQTAEETSSKPSIEHPFVARVNATYTVAPDAATNVKLEIRLRNTTSLQFAQEYALMVNSPDVQNVSARDSKGQSLAIETTKTSNSTILAVKFAPEKVVVGRNQEQLFTIEYTSHDTASRYGDVLEVTLPRLADPDFYEQYTVTLIVPETFGAPAWVRPEQYTRDVLAGAQVLRFTDVAKTGVSVLFGQSQTYDFSVQYHVSNPSQNTGVVEVALPPDTTWQQVWYQAISPQPTSLRSDPDGNWIAQFKLAGQATQVITANGQIRVSSQPSVPVPQSSPLQGGESLGPWWSQAQGPSWIEPQSYWPVQHELIQKAARENTSAQSIYNLVVETLQYNAPRARQMTQAGERLGAVAALQDPSNALCQEYTDVFIALSRAAGIPARRVTGYAVNQDSALRPLSLVADTLHAWPEYFDVQQGRWVPVDPTWGDTTGGVDYFSQFDLRHIVFARQGVSDTLPLAVGQYKEFGSEAQDVSVEIATRSALPARAELTVEVEQSGSFAWAGQPRRLKILIENKSGLARYTTPVSIMATGAELRGETEWVISELLPYQAVTREVELHGPSWFQSTPATLAVTLDANTTTHVTNVRRTIQHPILRLATLVGAVAFLSLGAGSVSVSWLRRLRTVRRKS